MKQGDRWRFATDVTCQVTIYTVFDSDYGHVLAGVGVVRSIDRGNIVITA